MAVEAQLNAWGEIPRKVQNHSLDSTRWQELRFRDGDIVIATWAKSGTTWLQQIVGQLIFNGSEDIPVCDLSPWLEQRCLPKNALLRMLEEQLHRRFLKTHLPADALVFSPAAKYIYIGRDGRDVVYSWYHHHRNLTPFAYEIINSVPDRHGPPFPQPIEDFREYFHAWLNRDGYPLWPFWSHIQSWWDIRDRPNVLLMHYENLRADLPGEVRRLAQFLGTEVSESTLQKTLAHSSFQYMKANAARLSSTLDRAFTGGSAALLNRGVSRSWSDVLTAEDVKAYEKHARRNLTPDCAHWLATGRAHGITERATRHPRSSRHP